MIFFSYGAPFAPSPLSFNIQLTYTRASASLLSSSTSFASGGLYVECGYNGVVIADDDTLRRLSSGSKDEVGSVRTMGLYGGIESDAPSHHELLQHVVSDNSDGGSGNELKKKGEGNHGNMCV